jgi:glutathione S-transferase
MYILHYAPDNASLIVRLMLEELGQPYRTVLVDRAVRAQDSAAYRALNPTGLIPVLETPDGAMAETGAILWWLAARHGALPADDRARAAVLRWLFFLSNTLHADLRMVFYPENYAGRDHAAQVALHDHVTARLRGHFAILDACLPDSVILDIYVGVAMRWAQLYARIATGWFDPAHYPDLLRRARALESRPSTQAAILAEGLGETPFSAARPCHPPEGSPL